MKNTQEILGLPVFSIIDGREVGVVKDLIVNPEEGAVEYLLVQCETWLAGAKVLPFKAVLGIGEHAVTTEKEGDLVLLAESQGASELVKRGIKVKGTRVLTKKGNIVGTVSEYALDENSGRIMRLDWENEGVSGVVPGEKVLTFGKDVLVVDETWASGGPGGKDNPSAPLGEGDKSAAALPNEAVNETGHLPSEDRGEKQPSPETEEKKGSAQLFIERQKQFLTGKTLTKDIVETDGKVLIPAGTELTAELLDLVVAKGRLMEVSQNVR